MLSLLVFRNLSIIRVESEVELSCLSPRLGPERAGVDRVVGLSAVKAEVELAAPLLLLGGERATRRDGVDGVDVHRRGSGNDRRRARNKGTRRLDGLSGRVVVEGGCWAALVFALLKALKQPVVDPNCQFLEGLERGWPIVMREVVLDVRLEAKVKLRSQRVIVPVE